MTVFSLVGVDLEDGHCRARVARTPRRAARGRRRSRSRRAGARRAAATSASVSTPLSSPPTIHTTAPKARERRRRRRAGWWPSSRRPSGCRRPPRRSRCGAGRGGSRASASRIAPAGTPSERARADAARMFATTCGAASPWRCELGDRASSSAARAAVVEERAVDEDAVDDAEVARARHAEAEADRARALLDLGVLDHVRGRGVRAVVDARDAGVRVDRGLRVAVRLGRAVPVEVVVGEVEARRWRTGAAPRARSSAGPGAAGSSRARRRARRSRPGRARRRARARRCCRTARRAGRRPTSIVAVELRRRGLAVGAGDEDPVGRRPSARHLVAHAPGELDVAPDAMPASSRPLEHGVVGVEAGRGDDHARARTRRAPRARRRADAARRRAPITVEDARSYSSSAVSATHEHVGAELGERVGDGEPGDAEARAPRRGGPPVGVPARSRRRRGRGIRSVMSGEPFDVEGADARRRRGGRAMIQKRTTIVISAQPLISKWWWIGLIRKRRLPRVSLKYTRCTMTEPVSMTKRPPMRTQRAARCG